MVSIIVATDINGVIAKNGEIPWKCKSDMKFFRLMTTGKTVVMGRKTFDTLGRKPLPNRRNIVVSSTLEAVSTPELVITPYFQDAVNIASSADHEAFCIGGEQVYEHFMKWDLVDVVYRNWLSRVTVANPEDKLQYFPFDHIKDWKTGVTKRCDEFAAQVYFKDELDLAKLEFWEGVLHQ